MKKVKHNPTIEYFSGNEILNGLSNTKYKDKVIDVGTVTCSNCSNEFMATEIYPDKKIGCPRCRYINVISAPIVNPVQIITSRLSPINSSTEGEASYTWNIYLH